MKKHTTLLALLAIAAAAGISLLPSRAFADTSTPSLPTSSPIPPISVQAPLPGGGSVAVSVPATSTSGTPSTTTPSSNSSGNAAQVQPAGVCVGCTSASAGPSSSTATAKPATVADQTISGGSAANGGSTSGSVANLQFPSLLTVYAADYSAITTVSGNSSSAQSRAALLDTSVANGQVATLSLLQSDSSANRQTANDGSYNATSSSASNGASATAGSGALTIVILHSEASSDGSNGTGSAYIASINGNEIGSSSSGAQQQSIPGVITIDLLEVNAAGSSASATAAGAVSALTQPVLNSPASLTLSGSGANGAAGAPLNPTGGVLALSTVPVPITGIEGPLLFGFLLLVLGGVLFVAARSSRNI